MITRYSRHTPDIIIAGIHMGCTGKSSQAYASSQILPPLNCPYICQLMGRAFFYQGRDTLVSTLAHAQEEAPFLPPRIGYRGMSKVCRKHSYQSLMRPLLAILLLSPLLFPFPRYVGKGCKDVMSKHQQLLGLCCSAVFSPSPLYRI